MCVRGKDLNFSKGCPPQLKLRVDSVVWVSISSPKWHKWHRLNPMSDLYCLYAPLSPCGSSSSLLHLFQETPRTVISKRQHGRSHLFPGESSPLSPRARHSWPFQRQGRSCLISSMNVWQFRGSMVTSEVEIHNMEKIMLWFSPIFSGLIGMRSMTSANIGTSIGWWWSSQWKQMEWSQTLQTPERANAASPASSLHSVVQPCLKVATIRQDKQVPFHCKGETVEMSGESWSSTKSQ